MASSGSGTAGSDPLHLPAAWRVRSRVKLRRRSLGIADNEQARECAGTIASWKPRLLRPVQRPP